MAHRCLLARREGRPASAGAGPAGGCRRTGGAGKCDASRTRGTGRDRPAGGRGDRGVPPGSAGAVGPRRGDSGHGLPGDTAGCSRRGRDRTRDRGRRAAGTGGRPASGGSPRPHGPGNVRVGWTNAGGCARPSAGRSTPPAGWNGPGAWSLLLQAPIPSPPGSRNPTRKPPHLPLSARLWFGFLRFLESDNTRPSPAEEPREVRHLAGAVGGRAPGVRLVVVQRILSERLEADLFRAQAHEAPVGNLPLPTREKMLGDGLLGRINSYDGFPPR